MQELVLIQPIRAADEEWTQEAAHAVRRREFEARLAECGPLAYRVARGVLRNDADAEDVAQEALLRAYRRFDRLRDPLRFRGWLVRIVFRLALDRARSAKRRELRETEWAQPARRAAPPNAEDLAASREFQAHFDRALEALPEKLRLVLLLAAMEGHTLEEVAALASRHSEIAIVRGQKEISGDVAMLCDKYKDTVIEVAAGAAVPVSLREHVGTCARCRAALDGQQTLFTMVDAGLRSRTNVGVPAHFDHRVRAALEVQASAQARRYSSVFAFASVAAAAAIAVAILLTHNVNQNRKEKTSSAVSQAELSASHSTAVRSTSKEIQPSSRRSLRSRGSASNVPRRLNGAAPGNDGVDVLVPEGQEELLVKYMEGIAARRLRVAIRASLQHEPDMKPVEVSPVETSALVVKPLPDLSSN